VGVAALAGCGSRGESGDDPADPPALPQLGINSVSVGEGNSGSSNLTFTVTLSSAAAAAVTANFTTADGTATTGSDYAAKSGTVTITPGNTSATIDVLVLGDADMESDETFGVTLSNASGATLAVATGTGTITNDDAPAALGAGLNDTGTTTCSNALNNGLDCNSAAAGTDAFPGQDAEHGRDVGGVDADGRAGFVFTKLDAAGAALADQSVSFDVAPWTCVRDDVTGLVWEIKADGARNRDFRYSWFNSSGVDDGGRAGIRGVTQCSTGISCDTESYTAAINALGLCNRKDWRLPTRTELLSLVEHGAAVPLIDTGFFPDTVSDRYWSGSPEQAASAWAVDLRNGSTLVEQRSMALFVRLVSGGTQP